MTGYRHLISAKELQQHLADLSWTVVDCRFNLMQPNSGFEEYRQGHIPGAVYANLDDDLAGPVTTSTGRHPLPSAEAFAETLGKWGIRNDSQVVVYDHGSGAIAARLWWMLQWLGHEQTAVLDGGYAAWLADGQAVSDSVETISAATFHPSPDSEWVISTEQMQALIESDDAQLIVDARDAARFDGRTEPIDTVAGHIPGAANHPFSKAIDASGHWKASEELREGWQGLLGEDAGRPWVAMCGSGVTACHLALSAALAGYRSPRLYIGSWSEWIRDPERPIAADLR